MVMKRFDEMEARIPTEREPGKLPLKTEVNPNAKVNAITLRSGKTTQAIPGPSQNEEESIEEEEK